MTSSSFLPEYCAILDDGDIYCGQCDLDHDGVHLKMTQELFILSTFLDDRAWLQASLPVKSGGLGIRSAVHLAPISIFSLICGL